MFVEHLLKTVPFLFSVTLYFRLKTSDTYVATEEVEILIKLLPVISLMAFILLHFKMKGNFSRYSLGILLGLIFSAIGDYFLIRMMLSESRFMKGVVAFAVAQLIYALTFGFKPFKAGIFLGCIMNGAVLYSYLRPGLKGALVYLIGVYVTLIHYMAWRAFARVRGLFEGKWTWGQMSCALGSIIFITSDFLIGCSFFRKDIEIPNKEILIMATYYAAQFGITVSVTDFPEEEDAGEKKETQDHEKKKKKRSKGGSKKKQS